MQYMGISFPFRLSSKGGVTTSTADINAVPHIIESIKQILGTHRLERCMEYHIYSDLDTFVFSPNDTSSKTLLQYEIESALKLETRIEVQQVDVTNDDNKLIAHLIFTVPEFDNKSYYVDVEVSGYE